MNFVRLRRDFGQRGQTAHVGPDSIRGLLKTPKGGAGPTPLATSLTVTGGILFLFAMRHSWKIVGLLCNTNMY